MDTAQLKKFAQKARRLLMEQIAARLSFVLEAESSARRETPQSVKDLEKQIAESSKESVIEKTAYIWFNRFCALRFMDANRYTRIGTVSPAEGFTQPEILMEAKQGHIDDGFSIDKGKVFDLLNGIIPSQVPQQEAYRMILVSACNHYNRIMPFLFERISDYTELLMPDDLLSESSILSLTIEALSPEACENVEVIGWLYQFYISEKKDEVFDGLKKNKKITPENIPAATQLFTPNWIVRYLVENSLGRLWMLNKPGSRLVERMEYYVGVASDQLVVDSKGSGDAVDYLKISSPEEIKICDPACGSGHMLVYAFDILYSIYEEEGYDANEIPRLILENNLYGIEIDERAGELAAFALTMKAREKYRRFFNKPVQPNICVLENVQFKENELKNYMEEMGNDLFTPSFQTTLRQFEEADNFGSLIRPVMKDAAHIHSLIKEKNISGQLLLHVPHQKVLKVLKQSDYLSQKYHVVIANPPYMGGKGMNGRLGAWLKDNFPDVKSDLFSAFMVRNTELALPKGQLGFMSPFVWMFISSYEKLRNFLIDQKTITSLIQLEYSGFDGATVPICTFTVENAHQPDFKGGYVRLSDFRGSENQAPKTLEAIKNQNCGWFFRASASDFKKIPGSPIAYWANRQLFVKFEELNSLSNVASPKKGLVTSDNNRFLRRWSEVSFTKISLNSDSLTAAKDSKCKWFPINAGGAYRKWFGNAELLINWEHGGMEIISYAADLYGAASRQIQNINFYFKPCITWSNITSSEFGARYSPVGFIFGAAGTACIPNNNESLNGILAFLNSLTAKKILKILNPTLNFVVSDIASLPFDDNVASLEAVLNNTHKNIAFAKNDWSNYEISWRFASLPVLQLCFRHTTFVNSYHKLRTHWENMTIEMQRLEEENNRIFIEAYGLQDELTPEVPLKEITLTCNPHYRYGGDKTEEELEALLLADTMKEFISYAVGCMLGRYSIDKPGLILANQGETIDDYVRKVVSGEGEVVSDQWPVISEEKGEVGIDQWLVDSEKEEGEKSCDCEKFQGSDCLAEGNGSRGRGLSDNETIPKGRNLQLDQSASQSSCINSVEYSRGTGSSIDGGVQELSVDSSRFSGGSGNSITDSSTAELPDTGATFRNHDNTSGSKQNASGTHEQTNHSPLTTIHSISFMPDEDNVIPILDEGWFSDDITERFKKFLKVTFGEENYEINLKFIEDAIGKEIRKYFLKDFYSDHVKRYKKRPIYWLFSSPKGSFNALIYMHRYQPDTASIVLNEYLREFRAKLSARKEHQEAISISSSASQKEKTQALKDIEKLKKTIEELDEYEREILYPLATRQISIDLDDGVKVNYLKFGAALKKIPGLDAAED